MKTPPTIPAPLPTDHRLLRLAGLLKVSRRDALGATVDAWAWIAAQATGGIVPQPVVLLDSVAEMEGYGEAAVAVGLVGTADGHIVAPAELRHQQRSQPVAGDRHDQGDDHRRRKSDRDRQRRYRVRKRLTEPVTPAAAPAAPDNPAEPKRTPRRLGEIEGFAVMLLYSRQGVPFYKLAGASPKEFTGTVSDPENPTLSDALRALLNSMKREAAKGLGFKGKDFRPTMEQVVAVARLEKDFVEQPDGTGQKDSTTPTGSASPDTAGGVTPGDRFHAPGSIQARAKSRLRTLCARNSVLQPPSPSEPEPVAEPGQRDESVTPWWTRQRCPRVRVAEHGERDESVTVTDAERDSVTVTELSRPESVTSPANSSGDKDLRQRDKSVTVTPAAPSSSSISFSSSSSPKGEEEEKEEETKETTTTRAVTPDTEQAAPERKPVMPAAEQQALLIWRYAAGLRTSEDAVRYQWNHEPEALAARLARAGIDPGTGQRLKYATGEDTPTSPQDAPGSPSGIGTGVQSVSGGQASGGTTGAPATTTPTGSPDDVDALGSRLSHGLTTVTARLQSDDHAEDADHDAGHDADQERRRAEALRALADFQRDHGRDSDGKPALRLTEPVG